MIKIKKTLIVALVLSTCFGLGLWYFLSSFANKYDLVEIPFANKDLTAPKLLVQDDLATQQIPRYLLFKNLVVNEKDLTNAVLTHPVAKGSWFTSLDLTYSRDPSSDAALITSGKQGILLPANWFYSPLPKVRPKDWVNIVGLFKKPEGGIDSVFIEAPVFKVNSGKDELPVSLLVGINQEALLKLLVARSQNAAMMVTVQASLN